MRGRALLFSMLLSAAAIAQAPPSATGVVPATPMATPPPVSGLNYTVQLGSEVRHNYLRGGVGFTTSYIDNYLTDSTSPPESETTISVLPSIAFDTATARQHVLVAYSPGFTFYQPSSQLNEVDNVVAASYAFHLSEHTLISAVERFQDSSSPFSPSDIGGGGVSGTPVSDTPGAIPPFAKVLTNTVSAEIAMQTGLNEMIGASGSWTELHYPNSAQTLGLSDSSSRGGTAFYNHRISNAQYVGVTYQFMDLLTAFDGGESATRTSTIMGYLTIYAKDRFSLSVSGGPQYYQVIEAPLPSLSTWGPAVSASTGWQGQRFSFAASYSHSVTGAGGLIGGYHTDIANATMRWQLARTWTAGASGGYAINKSVSSTLTTEAGNGHSVSESATLQHPIRGQVSLAFNYDRVHESYGQVAALAANPNADRVSVSLTWNFLRPLGR
jgi:hypothetical protein